MESKIALVEMEACRADVALTQREAELWASAYGFMPEMVKVNEEFLYCHMVETSNLKCIDEVNNLGELGENIVVGAKVLNCEPNCPMDGCVDRYIQQTGIVLAIFDTEELAFEALNQEPLIGYWFTNIYQ